MVVANATIDRTKGDTAGGTVADKQSVEMGHESRLA